MAVHECFSERRGFHTIIHRINYIRIFRQVGPSENLVILSQSRIFGHTAYGLSDSKITQDVLR